MVLSGIKPTPAHHTRRRYLRTYYVLPSKHQTTAFPRNKSRVSCFNWTAQFKIGLTPRKLPGFPATSRIIATITLGYYIIYMSPCQALFLNFLKNFFDIFLPFFKTHI